MPQAACSPCGVTEYRMVYSAAYRDNGGVNDGVGRCVRYGRELDLHTRLYCVLGGVGDESECVLLAREPYSMTMPVPVFEILSASFRGTRTSS